ncbi:hypothetical protein PVK06_034819 [Gossypium arboreum]|uniref:Uncharacterized protein n=1 Tax=Gossypium arboreum TaxID=29729 RepID=A0ABR0NG67_GOSAR|nr:hypothetical protein PVK06_034819 [Gossypium arboreum]
MNTPMDEVKHDILELKDEGHSTVIKNDELNMRVQQKFGVEECDEVLRNEEGIFTPIDIGLGLGLGLGLGVGHLLENYTKKLTFNEKVDDPSYIDEHSRYSGKSSNLSIFS